MMKIEPKSYGFRSCARCGMSFEAHTWNQRYCSRECRDRDYYEANAERIREKNRKYRQEHREQIREYSRQYSRQYYRKNSEKCLERSREYIRSHREQIREYKRKYYQEHREVIKLQACSNHYHSCASCPYDDCVREI